MHKELEAVICEEGVRIWISLGISSAVSFLRSKKDLFDTKALKRVSSSFNVCRKTIVQRELDLKVGKMTKKQLVFHTKTPGAINNICNELMNGRFILST